MVRPSVLETLQIASGGYPTGRDAAVCPEGGERGEPAFVWAVSPRLERVAELTRAHILDDVVFRDGYRGYCDICGQHVERDAME